MEITKLKTILFLCILFAGMFTCIISISKVRHDCTNCMWLDGSMIRDWENTLNEKLLYRDLAINVWGVIEYGIFRNGRPGVLVGSDGWLFTDEEFSFYEGEDEEIDRKIRFVSDVKNVLETKGIRLVVCVVPAKARVYHEYLGRYQMPNYIRNRYFHFVNGLVNQGVEVIDGLEHLIKAKQIEDVFLRTDTHWTPFGSSQVAEAIQETVTETFPRLDLDIYQISRDRLSVQEHYGDLISFVPLGPFQKKGPSPDQLENFSLNIHPSNSIGLFDDIVIPIVLVGTSYSADTRWHFADSLRWFFRSDVLNMSTEGQGPFKPMIDYLSSLEQQSTYPKLVIWEIPERLLPIRQSLVINQLN